MTASEHLRAFGTHLRRQRVTQGNRNRAAWARALGLPNDRVLNDVENGTRDNYSDDTLAGIDVWYGLTPGTAERVIRHGETWETEDAPEQKPTITRVVDGRVVEITDEPELLDAMARLKWWLSLGKEILDDVDRTADGHDVRP